MTIKYLLSPFTWFWVSFLVATILLVRRKKLAKAILLADLVLLLIISTPWIPRWALATLERQYPTLYAASLPPANYHILVLGHGHRNDTSISQPDRLDLQALGRLTEGIYLHRQLPGSKLILSGYEGSSNISQAAMLGNTAVSLGVSPQDTILQTTPTITLEEAKMYKARHGTSHPLIIVTSAAHMPRAMMLFRSQGLSPIAAPGQHQVKLEPNRNPEILPSYNNIEQAAGACREWGGILYTRFWLLSKKEIQTMKDVEARYHRQFHSF